MYLAFTDLLMGALVDADRAREAFLHAVLQSLIGSFKTSHVPALFYAVFIRPSLPPAIGATTEFHGDIIEVHISNISIFSSQTACFSDCFFIAPFRDYQVGSLVLGYSAQDKAGQGQQPEKTTIHRAGAVAGADSRCRRCRSWEENVLQQFSIPGIYGKSVLTERFDFVNCRT